MTLFSFYYCLPVESPTQTDICEINWKIFSFDDNTIVGEIAEIQIDFDQRPFHICLPFLSNIISTSTSHVSIFSFQFSMSQLLSTTWLVNFDVIINFFAIFFILSISCSSHVLTNSKFLTIFCENQQQRINNSIINNSIDNWYKTWWNENSKLVIGFFVKTFGDQLTSSSSFPWSENIRKDVITFQNNAYRRYQVSRIFLELKRGPSLSRNPIFWHSKVPAPFSRFLFELWHLFVVFWSFPY